MQPWQLAAVAVPLITFSMLPLGRADANATAASRPARTCHYDVVHVRKGHRLNVRSGAGRRHRVVNTLSRHARRVPGDCRKGHRWVHVHPRKGASGWSLGRYLKWVH
ncbi:SH3 domain-containing protein [Actinomadura logoneensis]|uniref:SH3 domain-containing protein n=1 Tax=Actinomadura logoneensis TaxID=2293572 RepID=A0A372JSU2_9ACTN|nr:SH3 domain-containing protein [Actinomadura logoneensis]RFU42834.1 SH3 domain-containing protein [Actinomadura logoneensis]